MLTLPNLLTLFRVAVIVPFVAAFWIPPPLGAWLTFALFAAAAASDLFDGWLARARGQTSDFGRMLDPIADKLLVAAALVLLAAFGRASAVAAILILSRELIISGLREWLAGRRLTLPVSRLAKGKTASQMLALALLLVAPAAPPLVGPIGEAFLWLAVLLTWVTGFDYLRIAWRRMRPEGPR